MKNLSNLLHCIHKKLQFLTGSCFYGAGKASCLAWGNIHYRTFDGRVSDFAGTCAYTLAETTNFDETNSKWFSIISVNSRKNGVASIHSINVSFSENINIELKKGTILVS